MSLFFCYLILLFHSCIHSCHQVPDPDLLWVGTDSPLFYLVPLPFHQKPAHKVPKETGFKRVLLATLTCRFRHILYSYCALPIDYTGKVWETQTMVKENKAKERALTQQH